MQLSEVNTVFQHKIIGGGTYGWSCYGYDTWSIDYSSKYAHGYVVFNVGTGIVYEVSVTPNVDELLGQSVKPYRWVNPLFKQAMLSEAAERMVDPDEAWDDVKWIDLETEEDFIDKASKMFDGVSFDTRVQVPIDLDNDTMLKLCMAAHERDITLNEMVGIILQEVVDKHESNIA